MARYLSVEDAAAAGITFLHEPEAQRFAVYHADGAGKRLAGEAHYSFPRDGVIDFDHTLVDPAYRGTGLSGLLAHEAVTSELAQTNAVVASCWFIEGYLAKHPGLVRSAE
ncbi:GNAT family N-acetyltransferase [Leucobacter albus]|uniref:GNAT family N-acetyltransferase n=1 Tax=Leucobacter albus TaxID=272210 RepID=A0ABW3TQG9_9MICO